MFCFWVMSLKQKKSEEEEREKGRGREEREKREGPITGAAITGDITGVAIICVYTQICIDLCASLPLCVSLSLEEEMTKIDAFKRELPLCMLLLNDGSFGFSFFWGLIISI
ncbi:unnamed protein product [Camellia sinensis]